MTDDYKTTSGTEADASTAAPPVSGDNISADGGEAVAEKPVKLKRSIAEILNEYYERRAKMYKEKYENGGIT